MVDLLPAYRPDVTPSGRRTSFSAEVSRKIVEASRMGATKFLAACYAGVAYSTVELWRQQVRDHDPRAQFLDEKAEMFDAIEKAKAEAAVGWLAQIEKAGKDVSQWRAMAWKLERIHPHDYGQRASLEIDATVSDQRGTGLEVVRETYDLSRLSDEQLAQLEAILDPIKSQVVTVIGDDFSRSNTIEGESREIDT